MIKTPKDMTHNSFKLREDIVEPMIEFFEKIGLRYIFTEKTKHYIRYLE